MKSTSNVKKKTVSAFPGLYTATADRPKIAGLVVLMHEEKDDMLCGVVVYPGKSTYFVGEYLNYWNKPSFEPYHGSVTIDSE